MKRTNIFLWAYITFIFVSIIVKFFYDYPMWSKLVVSITMASALFSVADIFSILYSSCSERINTYKPLLNEALKRQTKIKQQFDVITEKVKLSNSLMIEEFNKNMAFEKSVLDKIQLNLDYSELRSKIFKGIIICCTFLGFFSFFCTITFEEVAEYIIKAQDYISILSFVLILIAQQYSTSATNKLKKEIVLFEEANKYIKEIEQLLYEQEVKYNAD